MVVPMLPYVFQYVPSRKKIKNEKLDITFLLFYLSHQVSAITILLITILSTFTLPMCYAEDAEKIQKVVIAGISMDIYKAKQNAIQNTTTQAVGSYVLSSNLLKKENDIMADQELRDPKGKLLGRIKKVGGKLVIRDTRGRLKGRYDPKTNETRDANGKLIGNGNLLATLL